MPAHYRLIALTFGLSMLLYVNRIAISTATVPVTADLGLTDTQCAWVPVGQEGKRHVVSSV